MAHNNRPMRRSALIGPWGVGAIVPFPNDESLMIAGLDMWRYNDATPFVIKDERLLRRLGVQELRWPPDFRENNADPQNCFLKIPAVRFPTWHYCPFCGTMEKTTFYQQQPECECYPWPNGRKCNPAFRHRRKLIPERFIVICPDGHIDDFPVAEWLHQDPGYRYNPETCKIRRSTGGSSASLSGVYYECTCGARKNIAGATKPGALSKIGYRCKGTKPWLGMDSDEEHPCGRADVRVVLRGATNVWFADTRSSIYIPTDDEQATKKILAVLDEFFDSVSARRVNGELDRSFIYMLANAKHVDREALYNAFIRRDQGLEGLPDVTEEISEDEYHYGDRDGCISIENAAVYFREYYSNRKAQGLAIEKKQCIYLRDDVTDAQIIANLLSNPVKALIESGFFFYNEDAHVFSVSPDIWSTIDISNKAAITRICRQKLKDYYKD